MILALQLELYLNVDDYIMELSDGSGIRVVIHDQHVMPLPEEDGFDISPDQKTSVEITKVHKVTLELAIIAVGVYEYEYKKRIY